MLSGALNSPDQNLKMGIVRWQRADEVRGVFDHAVALLHGFAHQAELAILQIADAAVRHVRGGRRRARTKVARSISKYLHAIERRFTEVPAP